MARGERSHVPRSSGRSAVCMRLAMAVITASIFTASVALASFPYGPRTNYPLSGVPLFMAIADFNLDGRPDVICTREQADSVSLFLNDGRGGLVASGSFFTHSHN